MHLADERYFFIGSDGNFFAVKEVSLLRTGNSGTRVHKTTRKGEIYSLYDCLIDL